MRPRGPGNEDACALEISASFLAVPVRCVPGPREDACGREALGTRMEPSLSGSGHTS